MLRCRIASANSEANVRRPIWSFTTEGPTPRAAKDIMVRTKFCRHRLPKTFATM